ncbi:Prophage CP4-57 regulatory protein (AlpA) [compost metagenome]
MAKFLRRAEVEDATGLPKSTLYRMIAEEKFPRPVPLGERAVGWVESEVLAWQAARIAARNTVSV